MSDRRRFRWGSGRLVSTPIGDFWQVSLDAQDPAVPNLPLETPAAGGAAEILGAGGIASTEACGAPTLGGAIEAAGISSSEALGQPTVTPAVSAHDITGAGQIASDETYGSQTVLAVVAAAGIASAEQAGAPAVASGVNAAGIGTAEAHGAPSVAATISAAGISSAEAAGSPAASAGITAAGIATSEAFGRPTIGVPGGLKLPPPPALEYSERFNPQIRRPHAITGAGGIESGEIVSRPRITFVPVALPEEEQITFVLPPLPAAIPAHTIGGAGNIDEGAVGSPTIKLQPLPALNVQAAGIESQGAVGSPSISVGVISSALVIDLAKYRIAKLSPAGIESQEAVGRPTISLGDVPKPDAISEEEFVFILELLLAA